LAHSNALTEKARVPGKLRSKLNSFQDNLIQRVYAPALDFSLTHKAVILSILAGSIMISAGAFAGNHIKSAFFPEIEAP
jgi:Cu/Ag efflux pump CusA